MQETLLKPMGDETPEAVSTDNRESLLRFFGLESSQITNLFSELKTYKGSFTVARVADLLKLRNSVAADLYETFLDVIHVNSTHEVTIESIANDLTSIGCHKSKIDAFVGELKSLDADTRHAADVLATIPLLVGDYLHVSQLAYDLIYMENGPNKGETMPKAILPMIILQITLAKNEGDEDEKRERLQIYVPITEIDRLSKSIADIAKDAKDQVRRFKKEGTTEMFLPEG